MLKKFIIKSKSKILWFILCLKRFIRRIRYAFYFREIVSWRNESCDRCGHCFRLCWSVRDEKWLEVCGSDDGCLCLDCFVELANRRGIGLVQTDIERMDLFTPWQVEFFEFLKIYAAYDWAFQSPYHIAIHENIWLKNRPAYHVIGSNIATLKEFGKLSGCSSRMLSVLDTHGKKVSGERIIYHYDDWRKEVKNIYLKWKD